MNTEREADSKGFVNTALSASDDEFVGAQCALALFCHELYFNKEGMSIADSGAIVFCLIVMSLFLWDENKDVSTSTQVLVDIGWGPKFRECRALKAKSWKLEITKCVAIGLLLGIRRYWLIPLVITNTFLLLRSGPGDAISFVFDLLV